MHVPVLAEEILTVLSPQSGETVLDVTLGLGGHAESFLRASEPDGQLIGIDADTKNLAFARSRLESFGSRVETHLMNFRDLAALNRRVDILFADLGLSSPHVDDPERGFTFRASAPLDLRYDRSQGQTAGELLATSSVEHVAQILKNFGEVQKSHLLARKLHDHFQSAVPREWKTDDVVACVENIFTYRAPKVLPQVFQALRIAVNDELGALESLLAALPLILPPGGRAGIISYHSLEDRMVKRAFKALTAAEIDPQTGQDMRPPSWKLLTRKPLTASAEEIAANPRSRSAHFRAIQRVSADPSEAGRAIARIL